MKKILKFGSTCEIKNTSQFSMFDKIINSKLIGNSDGNQFSSIVLNIHTYHRTFFFVVETNLNK